MQETCCDIWASSFYSLNLGCVICKMGIIVHVLPTFQGSWEDELRQ